MALLNPILEDNEAVIHRCLPINIAFLTAVLRDSSTRVSWARMFYMAKFHFIQTTRQWINLGLYPPPHGNAHPEFSSMPPNPKLAVLLGTPMSDAHHPSKKRCIGARPTRLYSCIIRAEAGFSNSTPKPSRVSLRVSSRPSKSIL